MRVLPDDLQAARLVPIKASFPTLPALRISGRCRRRRKRRIGNIHRPQGCSPASSFGVALRRAAKRHGFGPGCPPGTCGASRHPLPTL